MERRAGSEITGDASARRGQIEGIPRLKVGREVGRNVREARLMSRF